VVRATDVGGDGISEVYMLNRVGYCAAHLVSHTHTYILLSSIHSTLLCSIHNVYVLVTHAALASSSSSSSR